MRMTIDTTAKLVAVEDSVNIVDFIATVKSLFPNDWEDYNVSRTGQTPYVPIPYYNSTVTVPNLTSFTVPNSTVTKVSNTLA